MPLNLKSKIVAFDTETTGLNPYGSFKRWGFEPARPFAFSFCDLEGNTEFVRWQVEPKTRRVIPNKKDLPFLKSILEDESITKIGHNTGYDIRMVEKMGFNFKGEVHDTLIMMHVCTGGSEMMYGLKYISKKYLEIPDEDEKELQVSTIRARNKGKKLGWYLAKKETHGNQHIKADYWMADPELLEKYATQDAVRASMLYQLCLQRMSRSAKLRNIYKKEMKLFWVVKKMEERGVRVHPEDIEKLELFYNDYMRTQLLVAEKHGGKNLNFRSPKQLVQKFIVEKKHTPLTYTEKGSPQVNSDFLVSIKDKDPLAKAVLEYNGAKHGIVSFLIPYKNYMVQEDGVWVLHTNYKQCGPVTGRFSASDPNLMQVASETSGRKRTEVSLHPRRCFGPRPGHVWYAPDYSQIEVWIFSFQAKEPTMMKALLAGHDFHGAVAKQSWGDQKDYEAQKSYYRKRAKLVLFCKLYGGGVKKTAYLLDCSESEAKSFIEKFNSQLPGVTSYMAKMVYEAKSKRVLYNPYGRMYKIEPDYAYKAVNYMIQGTAADVMKSSMIYLQKLIDRKWRNCNLLLTLHDELIIEVPKKSHSKELIRDIVSEMQRDSQRVGIPVPLPVSMKLITHRWSEEIKLCDKHYDINCIPCTPR